jgi:hypothetical protein
MGVFKTLGFKGFCSKICLIESGLMPKPPRKVFKRTDRKPRLPNESKVKRLRSQRHTEGMNGAI